MTLYRLIKETSKDDFDEWRTLWDAEQSGSLPDGVLVRSYDYGEPDGDFLVPVEPCEHGKYDGHWPNRKCCCKTHRDGVLGYSFTSFLNPNVVDWKPCWHEPWCDGLEES